MMQINISGDFLLGFGIIVFLASVLIVMVLAVHNTELCFSFGYGHAAVHDFHQYCGRVVNGTEEWIRLTELLAQ